MTPLKLSDLELAAKHCIPQGPWDYYLEQGCEGHGAVVTYTEDGKGMRSLKDSVFKRIVAPEETKRFLAHANPETVMRLCQMLRDCVEAMKESKARSEDVADSWCHHPLRDCLKKIRSEVDFG